MGVTTDLSGRDNSNIMRNNIIRRCAAIILMIALICAGISCMEGIFMRRFDQNQLRFDGYYEEEPDSLDYMIMGSSEVYTGFSPAEAYRHNHITNYNYAFQKNPVPLWKYELREILRRQHPKVLVVELNGIVYKQEDLYQVDCNHYLADQMPLSMNKIQLALDAGKHTEDDALSYLFPFFKYHGKRRDAEGYQDAKAIHDRGYALLRGSFSYTFLQDRGEVWEVNEEHPTRPLEPEAEACLREFLVECQNSGIEHILFVRFPHKIINEKSYKRLLRYNQASDIVKEYGFDYVDFDEYREEIGLDYYADYFDGDHLVARGQRKFTPFLADYLAERYHLTETELPPEKRQEWETSASYMPAFYQYFEDYLAAHPYEKDQEKNIKDSVRIKNELDKLIASGEIKKEYYGT